MLALWKKSYDKPRQHIKKQRYHFANSSPYCQSYGFSCNQVWVGCESWTIKKAKCWRIDAFKLWCWRRLLTVPRTARWSNQSILKEINLEYSLEGLMLKLQYFGPSDVKSNSLEKTMMLGKIESKRGRWQQRIRCLNSIMDFSSVQFSRSFVFDSLRPHESQHARPPCPSPTPGVHADSCPSSQWCHPAISSSVIPFSSCPQSLPASESFPISQLFAWGGQSTGVSALASFLQRNTRADLL